LPTQNFRSSIFSKWGGDFFIDAKKYDGTAFWKKDKIQSTRSLSNLKKSTLGPNPFDPEAI